MPMKAFFALLTWARPLSYLWPLRKRRLSLSGRSLPLSVAVAATKA